ncbi:MAG: hypothetical protein ACYYK0_06925 [Candidatus Eutrophobiaceae bacterium]
MKLLEKLRRILSGTQPPKLAPTVPRADAGTAAQADSAAPAKQFQEQLLYEKWLRCERWNLITEGIPLLLGQNPDDGCAAWPEELRARQQDLETHALHCVENRLLAVDEASKSAEQWQVHPLDLYRWANVGRYPVPQAFCLLSEFMLKTIKPPQAEALAHGAESPEVQHWQITLEAALSLLAHAPDDFRKDGCTDSDALAARIHNGAEFWFDGAQPALSESAMRDLLCACLQKRPPLQTPSLS